MKKILLFHSFFLLSLFSFLLPASVYSNSDDDIGFPMGYHIEENKAEGRTVYYGESQFINIDVNTFKNPWFGNMEYANDKNHVYFEGFIAPGLDPETYKLGLPDKPQDPPFMYAAYDEDTFCLKGLCIETENGKKAEFIREGIIRIEDKVYKKDVNKLILLAENSDPDYFTFGYKITDDAVYWYGRKIEEADAGSFELLHLGYAKDKNNVYFEGKVEYGADTESFTELGGYFIDKNGEHYDGQLFKDIEVFKQQYIDNNKSPEIVGQSIQTAIKEYEAKYSGYTPKPAQPQQIFKDIPVTHALYLKTKQAKEQGWIAGYPDGTFKPDTPVNRAEFAKMLMMAFYKGEGSERVLAKFPDVLKNVWYTPYLSRAVELKVMEGYPDGKMKPGNTIIKAEALKMALVTAMKTYDPQKEGEAWYERYRRYAEENFKLDFTKPEDMPKQMTRGECVELILEAEEK